MLNLFGDSKYIQKYKNISVADINHPLFSDLEGAEKIRRLMNLSANNVKKVSVVGLQINSFGNLRFQVELRQHDKIGRITLYATPNKNILGSKDDDLLINNFLSPTVLSYIQTLIDKIDLTPVIKKMQENSFL